MMTMEGMLERAVVDDIIRRLLEGKVGLGGIKQVQLSEAEIRQLCVNARHLFLSQPNLFDLRAPIKICGDIHEFKYLAVRVFGYKFTEYLVLSEFCASSSREFCPSACLAEEEKLSTYNNMARGLKKHLKRLNAPHHWMLDKLGGAFAPKPSSVPLKNREVLAFDSHPAKQHTEVSRFMQSTYREVVAIRSRGIF
ncbi:hypothetical protein IFM89_035931 [Coptis chinensis]|uniref:protein-serine/threonine phosphatase n=1 Tax=Coptis chinensis TaxID=261450 RepID=A0A835H2Y4_9MAGN|nr:hypothetical protein IFM89_035931 [Coptis chinensis]